MLYYGSKYFIIGSKQIANVLNFSDSNKIINLNEIQNQTFTELFSQEVVENLSKIELGPLAYKVFYTK